MGFDHLLVWAVLACCLLGHVSVAMSVSSSSECAVFGCGVLGTSLCKQLLESQEFKDWKITGVTKSTARHGQILEAVGKSDNFEVITAEECKQKKFDNVVFCAPPSGFEDYPGAVEECITKLWSGPSGGGVFVFTSSGGIYGPGEAKSVFVNEHSPLPDPGSNIRSARLINAEKAVLANGGGCLRLAGLYTLDRGAHSFWLKSGKDVTGREDGIINLLHYDDAAGSALAAVAAGPSVVSGNIFLISDGNPVTRRQICESAIKAEKFKDFKIPKFLGSDTDPIGKVYDGSASNRALKWDPKYGSFDSFMSSHS